MEEASWIEGTKFYSNYEDKNRFKWYTLWRFIFSSHFVTSTKVFFAPWINEWFSSCYPFMIELNLQIQLSIKLNAHVSVTMLMNLRYSVFNLSNFHLQLISTIFWARQPSNLETLTRCYYFSSNSFILLQCVFHRLLI